MGKLAELDLPGGARVNVDGGLGEGRADLSASFRLPGGEHELTAEEAAIAPLIPLTLPDRQIFGDIGSQLWETVSLEELVLHPGATEAIDGALAFLRGDLSRRQESVQLLNITGPTGDGKTTLATALAEKAKEEGMAVKQFMAHEWLSGTWNESIGRMGTDIHGFVDSVRNRIKQGKSAKGVIVINEAHIFAGINSADPEAVRRAGALNNLIDELRRIRDMQLVVVLTSRLPIAPDLEDRKTWTVEMADPGSDERGEVLYRLFAKEVDRATLTSEILGPDVLKSVVQLGTMTPEQRDIVSAYLRDRAKGSREEDPEMAWAEEFFALVNQTEGFSFRDMGTLVRRALGEAETKGKTVAFEQLSKIAADLAVDVRKRQRVEMLEGTRMAA